MLNVVQNDINDTIIVKFEQTGHNIQCVCHFQYANIPTLRYISCTFLSSLKFRQVFNNNNGGLVDKKDA